MKSAIRLFAGVALIASAIPASPQGMPVFDNASFIQAIRQVAAWKKQFEQMETQYRQLQAQNAALTGSRNLGMIMDNPSLRATVPPDVNAIFNAIQQSGASGLTPQARAIRNRTMQYNCEDRTGVDKNNCEAFLNTTAQRQAYQQVAMILLQQRMVQIQQLQGNINSTTDPKSIAELQARLQVESIQVSNDANRLQVLQSMADASDRAAQQALKERELKNLALPNDGSETFVFRPYKTN